MNRYRHRDPRYADQDHHKVNGKPLHDKSPQQARRKLFEVSDFCLDEQTHTCTCPAGKQRIAQRFATAEPVFGNVRHNKRLSRFILRAQDQGRPAVQALCHDAQHREIRREQLYAVSH